jgi:F-box and leucine-rich repeat protein 10/11
LVSEARIIERGSEQAKKEARENVPGDRVKDPGLLARELRWRVRSAAGVDSDAELGDDGDGIVAVKHDRAASRDGFKRRRRDEASGPLFRNWQPPEWVNVEDVPMHVTHDTMKVEDKAEGGVNWMAQEGLKGDVMRSVKTNGINKLRRLDNGSLERYSVVRTVEHITPSGASDSTGKL